MCQAAETHIELAEAENAASYFCNPTGVRRPRTRRWRRRERWCPTASRRWKARFGEHSPPCRRLKRMRALKGPAPRCLPFEGPLPVGSSAGGVRCVGSQLTDTHHTLSLLPVPAGPLVQQGVHAAGRGGRHCAGRGLQAARGAHGPGLCQEGRQGEHGCASWAVCGLR